MSGIRLSHDVLDAQLTDRHQAKIGRCDVLLLELREGRPPRVAMMLVGGPAREERIGRWMTALAKMLRAVGGMTRHDVSRIPFAAMRSLSDTIGVDVDRRDLESEHLERWLSDHVVCRIPGSQGERK